MRTSWPAALLVLCGCLGAGRPATLTHLGTLESLLAGGFDGTFTVGELLRSGDLGLGALDRLDGELVIVDGRAWQARSDGSVRPVEGSARTPFGAAVAFRAERRLAWRGTEGPLSAALDRLAPAGSGWALRVRGVFGRVRVRSPAAQRRPYRLLVDVIREQSEFDLGRVRATAVGFRLPPAVRGIDLPGDHLHLVTDDHRAGGHVLALEPEDVVIEVMRLDGVSARFAPREQSAPDSDAASRALH